MTTHDLVNEDENEREIAVLAGEALREAFIKASQNGPVMYVENDMVVRKEPNGDPVVLTSSPP